MVLATSISFLTPLAGLVALAVILPLIAFVRSESRSADVRAVLRLAPPGGTRRQTIAVIVVLAVLAGLGAAQPVLERNREHPMRTDVQAFFLFDTSRSMLASSGPGEPTRFDRAAAAGRRMHDALRAVPVGVASITDRVLPFVFPSPNPDTFDRVLRYSLGVDKPAAREGGNTTVSALDASRAVADRYFFRGGRKRLLVVFTDAESRGIHARELAQSFQEHQLTTILVRVGNGNERIYLPGGGQEPFVPAPGASAAADAYAAAVGGQAFDEDQLGDAIDAAKQLVGTGQSRMRFEASEVQPLGPYVFLAALFPLSFLLWRRNVS
jgi:hypothetical protein